jgi:hypothetical protein
MYGALVVVLYVVIALVKKSVLCHPDEVLVPSMPHKNPFVETAVFRRQRKRRLAAGQFPIGAEAPTFDGLRTKFVLQFKV